MPKAFLVMRLSAFVIGVLSFAVGVGVGEPGIFVVVDAF